MQKNAERVFESIVASFNTVFPGGGGDRDAADGNPALHLGAVNGGRGYPLNNTPKDGSVVGPIASYAIGGAGAALGRIPPNAAFRDPAAKDGAALPGTVPKSTTPVGA
jgi:hypothetical protein